MNNISISFIVAQKQSRLTGVYEEIGILVSIS